MLIFFLFPLLVASADVQLRLLHRVYGPGVPDYPFSLRATLDPTSFQLLPAEHLQDSLAHFYSDVSGNKNALYQLAFQTASVGEDFDPSGERLDISSVKACHIPTATSEYFTLHLDHTGTPFHIDYYLGGVPATGTCPSSKQLRALNFDQSNWPHLSNTTIRVQHATHPPMPELKMPPPLSPKGQVIAPEPEKTFLQKYWLYIVAALAILLFTGSPPEEEGRRPAEGR